MQIIFAKGGGIILKVFALTCDPKYLDLGL